LTRFVCEFYRYDQTNESAAIRNLDKQGFESVSVEFVRAIYDQLKKEQWYDNADKALYYTRAVPSEGVFAMWSQRYLLSFKRQPTDGDSHEIEVFDCFNDKSM
jgi:hypothetical protein